MKKLLAGVLCAALLTAPALAQGVWAVHVDGKALDLTGAAPYEENGHVMLPLRRVAEALGFTVTWDQETYSAKLNDGQVGTAVTIGSDAYFLAAGQPGGVSAPQRFGAAPALVGEVTFVPSELFTLLCGRTVAEGGVVSISKEANAQLPNPMRRYDDLAGAAEALGYALWAPTALPEDYDRSDVYVIGGDLLELRYHGQAGDASFRMAKGQREVSGDYTQYASAVVQSGETAEYTLKGDGKTVSLVTWTEGAYSFALSFRPGVEADTALAAAKSVKEAG